MRIGKSYFCFSMKGIVILFWFIFIRLNERFWIVVNFWVILLYDLWINRIKYFWKSYFFGC